MGVAMTYVERHGRFVCSRCGYELSAMMGDNEVPAQCGCVDAAVDDMMALLDQATEALRADDINRSFVLLGRAMTIADTLPKKEPPR